jgi:hypothetical protein
MKAIARLPAEMVGFFYFARFSLPSKRIKYSNQALKNTKNPI